MNGEKEARRGPIDGREGGIDLCRCSNLDGNGAAAAGVVGPVEAAARRRRGSEQGRQRHKAQATDAAWQGPAQAPRSWRGAWRSAPPRVGDGS